MEIKVTTDLLGKNNELAQRNREVFNQNNVFAMNMMGSPGSGKTTLLERTIEVIKDKANLGVIEGDIFTAKDAERIAKYNIPVKQINTGGSCHLDAAMVEKVLKDFDFSAIDIMVVENVGNLVCPVEFNVGEHVKIAVLSVIEGDDKPLKYPLIFKESEVVILNKVDLLPFCDVDFDQMKKDILSINPEIKIFEISSRKGEGVEAWVQWLLSKVKR
jgi:hydrogenase nickel incorporation protein HypB